MNNYWVHVSPRVATAVLPAGAALPGLLEEKVVAHGRYGRSHATLRIKACWICWSEEYYCYSPTVPRWAWKGVFNINPDDCF